MAVEIWWIGNLPLRQSTGKTGFSIGEETTMTVRSSPEPLVDNNWRMFATCKTVDPAVFYSPGEERGRNRTARESSAKQVCFRCPVIRDCLTFALETAEPHGVWGGTTPSERLALRRSAA
ncbi:WhiB family transcriptional regulator [Rhodococcus sp. NPDC056516]|uniref:WhiB family transcriptional regulator n=1 Tax=Rhodococcus sp. NPDC056516 TaxID=3345847 RepID=UPI00366E0D45